MLVHLTKKQRTVQGDRVRYYRDQAHMGLRTVAIELGVGTTTVWQWEQGIMPDTPEKQAKLAALFGVDEHDLFREYWQTVEAKQAATRARLGLM